MVYRVSSQKCGHCERIADVVISRNAPEMLAKEISSIDIRDRPGNPNTKAFAGAMGAKWIGVKMRTKSKRILEQIQQVNENTRKLVKLWPDKSLQQPREADVPVPQSRFASRVSAVDSAFYVGASNVSSDMRFNLKLAAKKSRRSSSPAMVHGCNGGFVDGHRVAMQSPLSPGTHYFNGSGVTNFPVARQRAKVCLRRSVRCFLRPPTADISPCWGGQLVQEHEWLLNDAA